VNKIYESYLSRYPSSQRILQSVPGRPSLTDLLGVSLQFLDAEAEMKRFFGSKVVLATKAGESSRSKKPQKVRSHLTRPQATWWPAQGRDGLLLHAYNESEVSEKLTRQKWLPMQEKWWTVEYSRKYKLTTREFMEVVVAGGGSKRAFLNILNLKIPQTHRACSTNWGNFHGTQIPSFKSQKFIDTEKVPRH